MNRLFRKIFLGGTGRNYLTKEYHSSAQNTFSSKNYLKPLLFKNVQDVNFMIHKFIIPIGKLEIKPDICEKRQLYFEEKIDSTRSIEILEQLNNIIEIEDPLLFNYEKQAMKQDVKNWRRINRKKLSLHFRKKRRKKYKFLWAKVRRRRNAIKDTLFKNEILGMLKDVQKFSAEKYVADKLARYRQEVPSYRWHGVVLPKDVIKECFERKRRRQELFEYHANLRRKLAKERGGTLEIDLSKDMQTGEPLVKQ